MYCNSPIHKPREKKILDLAFFDTMPQSSPFNINVFVSENKVFSYIGDFNESHDVEDPTINGNVEIHEIFQATQELSCRLNTINGKDCIHEISQPSQGSYPGSDGIYEIDITSTWNVHSFANKCFQRRKVTFILYNISETSLIL
jgi:hypothetical protein